MRFAPLCRGYGARLVGAGSGWADSPAAAIDAFRRERSLLRPGIWFVDLGADRLAAAAGTGSPRPEAVAAMPPWRCLATSLPALTRDGEPVPVLPGVTVLGRAAFGLADATGAAAEDALDDAAVLLAGLVRALLEVGARSVAILERPAGIEAGMLHTATAPVRRLLAHHRAAAWLIVEGVGAGDPATLAGPGAAGIVFAGVDVRDPRPEQTAEPAIGYGLGEDVFRSPVTDEALAGIVAAARGVPLFAPSIPEDALPETVLALADRMAAA